MTLALARIGAKEQDHLEMFYKMIGSIRSSVRSELKDMPEETSRALRRSFNGFEQISRALAISDLKGEVLASMCERMLNETKHKIWYTETNTTLKDLAQLRLLAQVKVLAQAQDYSGATKVAEEIDEEVLSQ